MSETILEATTRSGTTYVINKTLSFWTYFDKRAIKFSEPKTLSMLSVGDRRTDFEPFAWPAAERPEVGKSLLLQSPDIWRLSTEVVAVKEIEVDNFQAYMDSLTK